MMFYGTMAFAAERHKVVWVICGFPVAKEYTVWDDMVNFYWDTVAFAAFSAYLAYIAIARSCFSRLACPVRAAAVSLSAGVIPVVFSAHRFGLSDTHAFSRAVNTLIGRARELAFMNLEGCATFLAETLGEIFWTTLRWFGLTRCIFGSALIRAKSWFAIRPFLEFISAPLARKYTALAFVPRSPSMRKTAFFGTEFLVLCAPNSKFFFAVFANYMFVAKVKTTFAATKTRWFLPSVARYVEFFFAMFADKARGMIYGHSTLPSIVVPRSYIVGTRPRGTRLSVVHDATLARLNYIIRNAPALPAPTPLDTIAFGSGLLDWRKGIIA